MCRRTSRDTKTEIINNNQITPDNHAHTAYELLYDNNTVYKPHAHHASSSPKASSAKRIFLVRGFLRSGEPLGSNLRSGEPLRRPAGDRPAELSPKPGTATGSDAAPLVGAVLDPAMTPMDWPIDSPMDARRFAGWTRAPSAMLPAMDAPRTARRLADWLMSPSPMLPITSPKSFREPSRPCSRRSDRPGGGATGTSAIWRAISCSFLLCFRR